MMRPSRSIIGVQKEFAFIDPKQVNKIPHVLGKGVEGVVSLCTLDSVRHIPPTCYCVVKEFRGSKLSIPNTHASIVNEIIVGGLNHPGIIGAMAMTLADPPSLIFDYFNGGTLEQMFKDTKAANWP